MERLQERTLREIEAEIAGINFSVCIIEIMIEDSDLGLDRDGADVARFYLNRIQRKRNALIAQADVIQIAAEQQGVESTPVKECIG